MRVSSAASRPRGAAAPARNKGSAATPEHVQDETSDWHTQEQSTRKQGDKTWHTIASIGNEPNKTVDRHELGT